MSVPHDYIGLSEKSCSNERKFPDNNGFDLKETELRLGLPGFDSEEVRIGFKVFGSGAKRGFSDAIDGSVKWANGGSELGMGLNEVGGGPHTPPKPVEEKKKGVAAVVENGTAPAAKAQVVGWPPIRSFRKNTMATNLSKSSDAADAKSSGCLYVKVSMDGAPYLRKVDLKTYGNYAELSSGLEKMFSCFTLGQCASHGIPGREGLSESHLMDFLHGSEYVLTYEDKDGDWMLVGDVPWEMFTETCKRLRIMKGSEAIGLAPRAMEKCKSRN